MVLGKRADAVHVYLVSSDHGKYVSLVAMPPSTLTNLYRGAKVGRAYDVALGLPVGAKRSTSYADDEKLEEAMEAKFQKNEKKQKMQPPAVAPTSAGSKPVSSAASSAEHQAGQPTTTARCLALPPPARGSGSPREHSQRLATAVPRAKVARRPSHLLPWEIFEPRKPADICGQDAARTKVQTWMQTWLSRGRQTLPLLAAACVLQGPPGSGKTTLARCCALAAGMNVMEYGAHVEQDFPDFLRTIGGVDCEGIRTCLLVEDITEVLEAKQNGKASTMTVNYPVLCTAAFVLKRNHSQYSAVVSLWPLRQSDMRKILVETIAPGLRLPPSSFSALIEQSRGDARQLCVNAVFSLQLHSEVTSRDQSLSLYDRVRAYLGGRNGGARNVAAMLALDDPSHQECCLIQENFGTVNDLTIEAMAEHAQVVSLVDVLDTAAAPTFGLSARASCLFGGSRSDGRVTIKESSWWNAHRRREAGESWLKEYKYKMYESESSSCPGHWSTRALARHHFKAAIT